MIAARQLVKHFGAHTVLDALHMDVTQGERVGIIGLNGAGKTTLFRCLLGLVPFDGSLQIGGFDVRTDGRAARTQIGYVPQRAPHFDGTLRETIEFFCLLRGMSTETVSEQLALVQLSLAEHGHKPVRALSGGMLQKVLLALALGANISVLLLDEPTANLDPHARREFIRLLQRIPPDITVVLSSHQLADVEALAQRVLVLHQGRFVFDGRIADLQARGADRGVLHVVVAAEDLDRVQRILATCEGVRSYDQSGQRLSVVLARSDAARVIGALDAQDVRLLDIRLDGPAVEDVLEDLLRGGRVPAASAAHAEMSRV